MVTPAFQWNQQRPDLLTGLVGDLLVQCHPLLGLEVKSGRLHLQQILGLEIVDAVNLGPQALAASGTLPETVARGDTVTVQYLPTTRRPVECQARWRVTAEGVFDLEVSTLTPGKWDGLAVQTRSRLAPAATAAELHVDTSVQPGIVLYRPQGLEVSYVEMCHPQDGIALDIVQEQGSALIRYRLFGHDLEKGVILRGRLRGLIVPRSVDQASAQAEYLRFVNETPNLTL